MAHEPQLMAFSIWCQGAEVEALRAEGTHLWGSHWEGSNFGRKTAKCRTRTKRHKLQEVLFQDNEVLCSDWSCPTAGDVGSRVRRTRAQSSLCLFLFVRPWTGDFAPAA